MRSVFSLGNKKAKIEQYSPRKTPTKKSTPQNSESSIISARTISTPVIDKTKKKEKNSNANTTPIDITKQSSSILKSDDIVAEYETLVSKYRELLTNRKDLREKREILISEVKKAFGNQIRLEKGSEEVF